MAFKFHSRLIGSIISSPSTQVMRTFVRTKHHRIPLVAPAPGTQPQKLRAVAVVSQSDVIRRLAGTDMEKVGIDVMELLLMVCGSFD